MKPHNCELRNVHLGQAMALERWEREYKSCRDMMSSSSREKLDDFNAKVKVLASYGYLDKEMNLLFKGKVALDIQSTDKILTTELIFSGLLKDMQLPELIALLSVLYEKIKPGRGAEPCGAHVSDQFDLAFRFICDQCQKLIETEKTIGVVDTD